jgi:tetratricopeptide (TPR) repeat protein
MKRFALGLAVVLCVGLMASADDWAGKKITVKDDVKPGKRDGAGLVRGSDVLKKGTELTVKADDGTYLELDGKRGSIFKTEAMLASDDPNALPSDGTTWTEGTPLFLRNPKDTPGFELRSEDGSGSAKVYWEPRSIPLVRKDGGDGTVLVWDGQAEGWVKKKYFLTGEDVPVWAKLRLKADPNDVYALWVRACNFAFEDKFAEAEKDFTAAVKIAPKSVQLLLDRGHNRCWLDDHDGAIADYTEVLRLNPKETEAAAHRGSLWVRKGEYQKADDDLTVWLKDHADDAYRLNCRAEARLHLGQAEKAMADADASLKLIPDQSYPLWMKALALTKLKKYADAKATFEKTMETDSYAAVYVDYARFLATCPDDKYRDGVEALQLMRATKISYDNAKKELPAEYLEAFAAAYAEGAEYDLAVEKQTEAIKKFKADKNTPAAEVKRAEKVLELYKENTPLRNE